MKNIKKGILEKNWMILNVMDEYAKGIAIDFKEWCEENEYANSAALGRSLTNEELYIYYSENKFPIT